MLSARTCALGCERQRMVVDRRHFSRLERPSATDTPESPHSTMRWTALAVTSNSSNCGKVQASPSTSIPSVARRRRSEALARITNASGLSWFLISSAISLTIRWLTLHIFWPCSSSRAIQGCKSFSACERYKSRGRWLRKWVYFISVMMLMLWNQEMRTKEATVWNFFFQRYIQYEAFKYDNKYVNITITISWPAER